MNRQMQTENQTDRKHACPWPFAQRLDCGALCIRLFADYIWSRTLRTWKADIQPPILWPASKVHQGPAVWRNGRRAARTSTAAKLSSLTMSPLDTPEQGARSLSQTASAGTLRAASNIVFVVWTGSMEWTQLPSLAPNEYATVITFVWAAFLHTLSAASWLFALVCRTRAARRHRIMHAVPGDRQTDRQTTAKSFQEHCSRPKWLT